MPALSDTSRWRTHPQSTSGFLYLLNPDVVIKRRINQSVFAFPITELTYDNPDANGGSYTDTEVFQTVVIKDGSTEAIKGMTYVNFPLDADTIPIGVMSSGDIQLVDNDIIEVWNDFRLWARLPRVATDGTLYKDWTRVFVGADNVQPPVANGGTWYAQTIDPDTELITVDFDATNSFAIRNFATISSYLWDVRDGTITVGADTDAAITATFPAGYRWVKLTVTDSNSRSADTYILVVAADDATALAVTSVSLQGSREGGWEAGFNVLENDVSAYPEGTACIYWVEEDYGGVIGSLNGKADREHIAFTGWLTRDTSLIAPDNSDWQITATNAFGIMRQLPAFSQTLQRPSGTATSWFEVPNLDWLRYVCFLIEWHSTLFFVCDVINPEYTTIQVLQLDAEAGSLLNQMEYAAKAVAALFTCDHQGRCYFELNQHLMSSAQQAAATTTVSITAADWVDDIAVQSQYQNRVALVVGYAIVPSANAISAVQSRAPGVAPGQGGGTETLDRQLATQAELNTRVGRLYQFRNRETENISLTVNHQGIIADPAWGEFIQVTIAANTNKRGINASSAKMVLTRVNISYNWDTGTEEQTWELEPVASFDGGDAITVVMPGEAAPESGEYVPQAGTWSTQAIQPPQFFSPYMPYVPTVLGGSTNTDYAIAAGDDNLSISDDGGATWTVSDTVTDFYCLSFIHSDPDVNPITTAVKVAALWTDGTDCIIRYNDDVFGAGTWSTEQTYAGYQGGVLRHVAGVADGFAAFLYLAGAATSYTDAMTGGLGAKTFLNISGVSVDISGGAQMSIPGQQGNYSSNEIEGEYSGYDDGFSDPLNIAMPIIDLGEPSTVTLTTCDFKRDPDTTGGDYVNLYYLDEDKAVISSGQIGSNGQMSTTYQTYSSGVVNVANVRYVVWLGVVAIQTPYADDLYVEYTPNNATAVKYTDDAWATDSTVTGGSYTADDNLAGDCDDHNLGVHLFVANHGIWYTAAYDQATATELTGLTGIDGSASVGVVRVPYTRVDNPSLLNNTKTALQFICGTESAVSGKTLWLVIFNANTGAIVSQTNITPIISGTTYVCLSPQGLETCGADTSKILMCAVPAGGDAGDTVLIYSGDGGAAWVIQNSTQSADLSFVRWSVGSTTQVWFAARAATNKAWDSSNRGGLLADRTGDLTLTDIREAYGFNAI